jgi:Protein of unknown function (DUF3040)
VLSDDELQALREIERRLRWESPELVRLFNSQEPQPATNHRQRARTRALLAAAAITGLVQLGPRMLTEAEVRTQQRVPLPRTASFDTTIARRADPVCPAAVTAPIEVVDISVAPSPIATTPLCRAA